SARANRKGLGYDERLYKRSSWSQIHLDNDSWPTSRHIIGHLRFLFSGGRGQSQRRGREQNYAYYRWFSHSGRVVLENGNFNSTVGFTNLSDWSSVFGEYANARTSTEDGSIATPGQGFAQALANPAYIGITCGGRFFGHGVYATGQATFMMNSFSVQ